MGIASALGLLLAIPAGFLAMAQVSDLQTISTTLAMGELIDNVMRTATFMMLLLVVIAGIGAVLGALSLTIKGR